MVNDKLNKKLVEWAGFRRVDDAKPEQPWDFYYLYGEPDPKTFIRAVKAKGQLHRRLNLTESLDACFKWLVPKVCGLEGFRLFSYQYIGFARDIDLLRHSWGIQFESGVSYYASARESALAVCLAIEKLIDGEK